MKKVLMIKYAELTTKKGNRNFFIKTLKRNIDNALNGLEYKIIYDFARMFVYTDEIEEATKRLQKVFGIHEIDEAFVFEDNDIENIKEEVLNIAKEEDFKTFKIETKRSLKSYPIKSMEISRVVGAHILKNVDNIKVDVNSPELHINIEIRKDNTIIYYKQYKCLGGYPSGALGKGLLMLSGGIDSPVAAFLASKRGVKLEYIYFDSPPHTSIEAKNKVITLAKKISEYSGETKLHVINFTKIQEEILKNCPHEYLITIMRRMMYRISENLANEIKALALFNGEDIGQVASQTLTSMRAINEVVTIPVIRPVATYDKLEIIDIAKRIGTYETSIMPYEDCCTVFVPEHPIINPNIDLTRTYETNFDFEQLLDEAVKNHEIIEINNKKEINDLL